MQLALGHVNGYNLYKHCVRDSRDMGNQVYLRQVS
jgi:hypothetical protein